MGCPGRERVVGGKALGLRKASRTARHGERGQVRAPGAAALSISGPRLQFSSLSPSPGKPLEKSEAEANAIRLVLGKDPWSSAEQKRALGGGQQGAWRGALT